ncbi:hypothetical protein B6N13_02090 [Marinomonas sp. UCMA 3892]|uniref:hypothetical protein n=1 Tax=Marinomonas sp. UCMA 3892 TaxID=1972585 RepID=UPI00146AC02F|nr:hypothetical protein [Marinomonas sp. UCMA 3892]NLU96888.1 hypothetical protein [Marinomonas sp. UCMA 3892]
MNLKRWMLFFFLFPVFVVIFIEEEELRSYVYVAYACQLIVLFIFLFSYRNALVFINPLSLSLIYVLISFSLGSWAFSNDLVYVKKNLIDSFSWKYFKETTFLILFFNFIVFYILSKFKFKFFPLSSKDRDIALFRAKKLFFGVLLVCFPFFFFDINLEIVGGSGGLSVIPKSIFFISLIYILAVGKYRFRIVFYIFILIGFSVFSYEDKRDAIFFIFPIFFLESLFNDLKLNFKGMVIGVFSCVSILILIILMSISRGYGGYELSSSIDSVFYIFDYIKSDLFYIYLFNNLEVNYTYFHTMQAFDYIQDDIWLIKAGSTLVKFLFLLVPRSVFSDKPDSFIDIYTSLYDPTFRALGGSWPPNFYAELFWNFSYFSIFLLFFFYYLFFFIYNKAIFSIFRVNIISSMLYLYFIYLFLSLVRGSGFDLFVFNFIIAAWIVLLACFIVFLVDIFIKEGERDK